MATPKLLTAADRLAPDPIDRIRKPFQRFTSLTSAGGLLLLWCTVVAMVWANSPYYDSYHYFFHVEKLTIGFDDLLLSKSVAHWINDALMALFFFVVGLEIKREILVGELSSPKKAALPIAAAIGGMAGPALIFVAFNAGQETIRGWGVPMATDIAFALGILSLLGKRIPVSLKVFLTSLAIADDLGALIVIALFYTEDLATNYLIYAVFATLAMITLNLIRVRSPWIYFFFGLALWYFVFKSGVHATIAGVVGAMTIPATARVGARHYIEATRELVDELERLEQTSPYDVKTSAQHRAAAWAVQKSSLQVLPVLQRLEDALHPYSIFLVIPIFALANAGVPIQGDIAASVAERNSLGIIIGLAVGKPAGIFLCSFAAVKIGLGALPRGVTWRHIFGAGWLGGIGFTMALFIGNLAYAEDQALLDQAKLAVLIGSAISAIAGTAVLATARRRPDDADEHAV